MQKKVNRVAKKHENVNGLDKSSIFTDNHRERSGSVVECLTPDGEAEGSSLTAVTALWSVSKTHLS